MFLVVLIFLLLQSMVDALFFVKLSENYKDEKNQYWYPFEIVDIYLFMNCFFSLKSIFDILN
jgi:hypothetical protein